MKITGWKILHGDLGWRSISFLRVDASDGISGWAEYIEGFAASNSGLSAVVGALINEVLGEDPNRIEAIAAKLANFISQSPGGVNQQAVAAIVNALVDIKAKLLGVPAWNLLGGAFRNRIPLYWSHCGSYRVRYPDYFKSSTMETYDDIAKLGEEVRGRGFKSLKMNVLLHDGERFEAYRPARGASSGFPALNPDSAIEKAIQRQLQFMREGAGPDVEINLDLNMNFKPEALLRIIRLPDVGNLGWLEMDNFDPNVLSYIRRTSHTPIASCENIYGPRDYKNFFEAMSVDIAIIDVVWNGYLDALKIAALADAHGVNVAPHNYFGHLSDYVTASFSAVIPNLRIMEMDIDAVPWKNEFYTHPPTVEDGQFLLSGRPGWGTDIVESAVLARRPTR